MSDNKGIVSPFWAADVAETLAEYAMKAASEDTELRDRVAELEKQVEALKVKPAYFF